MKKLPAIHPGEILLEEFMKPLRLSQNALARDLGVDPRSSQSDCEWQTRNHGNYGPALGAILPNDTRFLDESPVTV